MVIQNENTKTKMKQNQNKTKHQVNSYFRDHLFIFQAKLFADEINTGRINLAVYNANTLTRNDLIGAHEVDLMRVYNSPGNSIFMPFSLLFAHVGCLWFFFILFYGFFLYFFFFFLFLGHELYQVWVALVDTTNEFSGVQGYHKLILFLSTALLFSLSLVIEFSFDCHKIFES